MGDGKRTPRIRHIFVQASSMFHISSSYIYRRSVYGKQKWAEKRDDEVLSEDSESDFETFLASTTVANAITRFKRSEVSLRRRQDLNIDARGSCGPVGTLSWQPLGQDSMEMDPLVAFSTGKDKEVRICRVMDNGKCSKIEYSIKTKKLLVPKVIKLISQDELVVTNDNPYRSRVLVYNVETGTPKYFSSFAGKEITSPKFISANGSKFSVAYDGGNIVTLDKRSKDLVSDIRLNNPCVGLSWNSDGTSLFAGDERANLYEYEARMGSKCVQRMQLETISSMSSFTMNGDKLIACGSAFGTVDIVDTDSWTPVMSFDKLLTEVNRIAFHPIHKSMVVASSAESKNAVRVYECSNGRTMAGWPKENEPLGRALDMGFSDCGRFLAVGCKSGRVQLYAL